MRDPSAGKEQSKNKIFTATSVNEEKMREREREREREIEERVKDTNSEESYTKKE